MEGVDEVGEERADAVVVVVVGAVIPQSVITIDRMLSPLNLPASKYPHLRLRSTPTINESVIPGPTIVRDIRRSCRRVQSQVRVQVRAFQEPSELQSPIQRQSTLVVRRLAEMLQHFCDDGFCGRWVGERVHCDGGWFYHVCLNEDLILLRTPFVRYENMIKRLR